MRDAKHISAAEFSREVLRSDQPVLVDFYSDWNGPCQTLLPIIQDLAEEYDGRAKILKVDTDAERELAQTYDILSIPTFVFFQDGKVFDVLCGYQSKRELRKRLDSMTALGLGKTSDALNK